MSLLLGIDTGGTYTDAVLFDEEKGVIASAKSLTTRQDYAIGIGNSVASVIGAAQISAQDIGLVSLSTTLATNALVEGQGGRICLILIGFDETALDRNGLREALKGDPVIFLTGGHNGQGEAEAPLDEAALERALEETEGHVTAFAVASLFAIRNPEHELRVRDILLARSEKNSVTCSHELSSKLDGPRRALTSVLNARLINLIHHLITSSEALFNEMKISAPLMVVQGDGALISAEIAKLKPIETILSGPAASLVGAAYLSGEKNAIVSDIGGTTTDIAVLERGSPRLDAAGATVGGWRTMVEAVAIHTVGLGGDSEVAAVKSGFGLAIALGPRRLVPVSLLATEYPGIVQGALDAHLLRDRWQENFGRFAYAVGRESAHVVTLSEMEAALLAELETGPKPLDKLITRRRQMSALDKLVSAGLVMIAGFTPSDAAHVLGFQDNWDKIAAKKAALLFSRQKDTRGQSLASTAEEVARMTFTALVNISSETLLTAALGEGSMLTREEAVNMLRAANQEAPHPLIKMDIGLQQPVIGLGASAHLYYPEVAAKLRTKAIIPDHAAVANAVGAVVGQVRTHAHGTILPMEGNGFRLHHNGEPLDFSTLDMAVLEAERLLTQEAGSLAREAGAAAVRTNFDRKDNIAHTDGHEMFIESVLEVTAFGRPRITR